MDNAELGASYHSRIYVHDLSGIANKKRMKLSTLGFIIGGNFRPDFLHQSKGLK